MMLSKIAQLSALLVVLVGGPALADDQVRLLVEVTTNTGKPVERASVVVDFIQGRSLVKLGKKVSKHWEVRTNQDGIAKIPPLPEGKVRVQIIAKGYQTFGQVYDVSGPEQRVEIKLNPPQPQHSAHQ